MYIKQNFELTLESNENSNAIS